MATTLNVNSPWLLFAVGFAGGIVLTRHLITLPTSELLFEKFDQKENDEIFQEELARQAEFDALDGGTSGNAGGLLGLDGFEGKFRL